MEIFIYQTNRQLDTYNFFEIFKGSYFYYDWAWKRSRKYIPYTSDIVGTFIIVTKKIPEVIIENYETRPIYLSLLETRIIFPEITNKEFHLMGNYSGEWNRDVCDKIEEVLGEFT